MTTQQQHQTSVRVRHHSIAVAINLADSYRFSAEDERCRAVREFYELRGLHRRGLIGDCALVTAFRNATKATGGRDQ